MEMTRVSIYISETAGAIGVKLGGHVEEGYTKLLSKAEHCGPTNSRDIAV